MNLNGFNCGLVILILATVINGKIIRLSNKQKNKQTNELKTNSLIGDLLHLIGQIFELITFKQLEHSIFH